MGVLKYLRSDPLLATKILLYFASSRLHPMRRRDLEELQRIHGFHMGRAVMGSITLHILMFLAFYIFLSQTYGRFWF